MTGMQDKRVWLKWMELRIHNEIEAIETPIGFFPAYEGLKKIFKEVLNKDYTEGDYLKQFILTVSHNITKIERITEIYNTKVTDAPNVLFRVLQMQKKRLEDATSKYGNYVAPTVFKGKGYEVLSKQQRDCP